MLDITVTVILVNKTAELVIVQKLYQLGEYIFVLVHLTANLIGCKITNSNRRALKIYRKRLYFSDFKERLFHFNGTVVFLDSFSPLPYYYGTDCGASANSNTSDAFFCSFSLLVRTLRTL